MASKSKTKGKGFERQVAKLLADTLGGHWQRVPNSGAMVGGINAALLAKVDAKFARLMSGDIIVPQEFEGLEIECKSRAAFNFMHLLRSEGNKELNEWIKQTWQHNPKVGLLMFKANNTPIFVCHPYSQLRMNDSSVRSLAECSYPLGDTSTEEKIYFIHEASNEWLIWAKDRIKSLLAA